MNNEKVAKTLMRMAKMLVGDAQLVADEKAGTVVRVSKEQRTATARQVKSSILREKERLSYRCARIARTVNAEILEAFKEAAAPLGVVRALPKLKNLFLKYQITVNSDGTVDIPYFTALGYPSSKMEHYKSIDTAVRQNDRVSSSVTNDVSKFTALLDQVTRAKNELETKKKMVDVIEGNKDMDEDYRALSIREEIDGALGTFDMHLSPFMSKRYKNADKKALNKQLTDMREMVAEGDFKGAIALWRPITERVEQMINVFNNMLDGITERKAALQSLFNYMKREKSKHKEMSEGDILQALLGI